ncbi:MAG: BON domain-containing protein [Chloroflexota bacterium]
MATLRSDADVRRDVLDALETDVRVDSARLSAEVVNGIVTLRGLVATEFEKHVAEDLVRRIKGVRDVATELRVVASPPRPDEQVAADVRAALSRDVWVDDSQVAVRVRDGVVYLSGSVEAYSAKSHAEGDAWGVDGVADVVDAIALDHKPTRADAEISREVRADLDRNLRLEPRAVTIDVQGGTVYLRGTVTTIEQKWLADEIAWWAAGVRDVVNELTVEQPGGAPGGPA